MITCLHLHACEQQYEPKEFSNPAGRDVTCEIARKDATTLWLSGRCSPCPGGALLAGGWSIRLFQGIPSNNSWFNASTVYSATTSSEREIVVHYLAMLQPSSEGQQSSGDRLEACDASLYVSAKVKLLWAL